MQNRNANPVVWFEIYVNDMDRAAKFYEEVLQVKLTDMGDPTDQSMQMRAFPSSMENFGTSGALVKMKDGQVGGANTILYFACDDCAEEESRVQAAGGKVCQPKMSIGEYGFCTIITDTEGNTVGLHSMQ